VSLLDEEEKMIEVEMWVVMQRSTTVVVFWWPELVMIGGFVVVEMGAIMVMNW
jgi:hypothetical protein